MVLSQISILGAKSENQVSEIQWLTELKIPEKANLRQNHPGGPWVFDASGKPLRTLRVPELPANCAFGGPDHRTLLLTARTSLYTVRVKVPGITPL